MNKQLKSIIKKYFNLIDSAISSQPILGNVQHTNNTKIRISYFKAYKKNDEIGNQIIYHRQLG